jgi:hypothetical protein
VAAERERPQPGAHLRDDGAAVAGDEVDLLAGRGHTVTLTL